MTFIRDDQKGYTSVPKGRLVGFGAGRVRVIRHKQRSFYTEIPNSIANARMSIEAKGALLYMLSRSRSWIFRHDHLRREWRVGQDRFRRIMQELIDAGYVHRSINQPRDDNNKFTPYEYVVCDFPMPQEKP